MKRFAIGLLLALASTPASAMNMTYGDWDAMGEIPRGFYIGGALDAFIFFNRNERARGHFNSCVEQAGFGIGRLSSNVRAFAQANPEFQRYNAQYALLGYMTALCGKAPE